MVDKWVDECYENSDEVKIVSDSKNKCHSCILYIVLFSIFFIMLELVLILFTINTSIVIKKIFLNIMIMFIKQKIININGRN